MGEKGMRRPGAWQIVIAAIIGLSFGWGPMLMAMRSPMHEWGYTATGPQAILVGLAGVAALILYVIGFVRYGASKGYSGWIGFWLSIGNVAGLITLLLLPDLREQTGRFVREEEKAKQVV